MKNNFIKCVLVSVMTTAVIVTSLPLSILASEIGVETKEIRSEDEEKISASSKAFLPETQADKDELQNVLNYIPLEEYFTADSYADYVTVEMAAFQVLNDVNATQEEVDEALDMLKNAQNALKIAVGTITINGNTEVTVGKNIQLGVIIQPETAADKTVNWSSSDESVAAVDSNGVVTGIAAGSVTITASANDDRSASGVYKVTVKEADSSVTASPTPGSQYVSHIGQFFIVNGLKYKVTKDDYSGCEVRVINMTEKSATVKIPVNVANPDWDKIFNVTSIKANAFKKTAIKRAIIGKNVAKIGKNAFRDCKNLKTVTIGKNVKTIGSYTFYGCKKLTKVTIKSTFLKSVKKNAFKGIAGKTEIKVPAGKKKSYSRKLEGKIAKGVTIKSF